MALLVEDLPDDAGKIGLRELDIKTAVRSRLRGARLYSEDASPFLYVRVTVLSPAFAIEVMFQRLVEVSLPQWIRSEGMRPLTGLAPTWRTGSAGTFGANGSGFILSGLGRHPDKFIDEYLRVNDADCRKSK